MDTPTPHSGLMHSCIQEGHRLCNNEMSVMLKMYTYKSIEKQSTTCTVWFMIP